MLQQDPSQASIRVDIWLWAARFFKTRALAKNSVVAGKVELNGQNIKPAKTIHVNDQLVIWRADEKMHVVVVGLARARGSASFAQTLYQETPESIALRTELREKKKMTNAGYQAPQSKPDKRARRLIRALGDIEAF